MGRVKMKIDINCDLGEGFGHYDFGLDSELMKYISSANIACGFHAGDPATMAKTVQLALERGVKIGAHPGYPDLQGFGRRAMDISPEELKNMIVYQVAALKGFIKAYGGKLHHVKPHGALYNKASRDKTTAMAIVEAVKLIDQDLIIYGPPMSELYRASKVMGLKFYSEAFADRAYRGDGQLVSRDQDGALIHDVEICAKRIEKLLEEECMDTIDGDTIKMKAQTICVHGDNEKALRFVKTLNKKLHDLGYGVE